MHPLLRGLPSILTTHNLAYRDVSNASWFPRLSFRWNLMHVNGLEHFMRISVLKGNVMCTLIVTTVRPQYVRKIQLQELGFGFDGTLRYRSADLLGILNGIDYDQ